MKKFYFQVSINTKENDQVDIKCGGPYYLGFDFKIFQKDGLTKGKVEKAIKKMLDNNNIHYLSLHVSKEKYIEPKIWSLDEINDELLKSK